MSFPITTENHEISTDRIDGKLDATRNKTVEARDVASGDSSLLYPLLKIQKLQRIEYANKFKFWASHWFVESTIFLFF